MKDGWYEVDKDPAPPIMPGFNYVSDYVYCKTARGKEYEAFYAHNKGIWVDISGKKVKGKVKYWRY